MKSTNEIIAANLVKLRKERKLTQAELAEKIHYSDKSISKWEKGESCPSIAVANEIAKFYGLTLNDLVDENLESEEIPKVEPQKVSYGVITLLACSVVWLVATVLFVYSTLSGKPDPWMLFICAVPITCIVLLIFNSLWGNRRLNYVIISFLNWTLLTTVFLLVLLLSDYRYVLWVVFIIGIPVQISTILWSQLKRTSKPKRREAKQKKANMKKINTDYDNDFVDTDKQKVQE